METAFCFIAAAICVAAAAAAISKYNPELGLLINISAAICGALLLLSAIQQASQLIEELATAKYCKPAIKCIVLSVISKPVSEQCRSSGQAAIAVSVEYAAAAASFTLCIPLIREVASLALSLLD